MNGFDIQTYAAHDARRSRIRISELFCCFLFRLGSSNANSAS